jgi:hypothetical protein
MRASRAIRENRASCRIALALAMFGQLRGQLADDWNTFGSVVMPFQIERTISNSPSLQFSQYIPRSSPRRAPVKAPQRSTLRRTWSTAPGTDCKGSYLLSMNTGAPRDSSNATAMGRFARFSTDEKSYAHSYFRFLSDLWVVDGLRYSFYLSSIDLCWPRFLLE